jgi:predicted DNA-binding protein
LLLAIKLGKSLFATDDGKAIKAARFFKVPFIVSSKIVVELFRLQKISFKKARESLEKLGKIGRYSPEIIADALVSLMEEKMGKPTTIRIPEDLLDEINEFVQELKLDRSAYLREVVRKGFTVDKQDRLLLKYVRKELSQMEVCEELKWDPWEFLTQLKARNLYLNVELEDWLDAAELPS